MNEQAKKFFAKIKGNINASVNEDPQNWSQNDIDNVSNEINQTYKDKISLDDEKKKLEDQVTTLTSQLEKKTADFEALEKVVSGLDKQSSSLKKISGLETSYIDSNGEEWVLKKFIKDTATTNAVGEYERK